MNMYIRKYIHLHTRLCTYFHMHMEGKMWMHRCCVNMYLYMCIHVNRLANRQRGNWDMDPETTCNCSVDDPFAPRKLVFCYNHRDPESSNRIGIDTI